MSLEEVKLDNTYVMKIAEYAFHNCGKIKTVTLPNTLEKIGMCAFGMCTSLEKIEIPASVKILDPLMFECCYKLKKVKLNDGLKEIGSAVFYNCDNLQFIKIPKSVQVIDKEAFMHTSLQYINRLENGEIILSSEPIERNSVLASMKLDKIKKVFPNHLLVDIIHMKPKEMKNYFDVVNYYYNKKVTSSNISINEVRELEIAKLIKGQRK